MAKKQEASTSLTTVPADVYLGIGKFAGAAELSPDDWDIDPDLVSLKEPEDSITGWYIGEGNGAEVEDKVTKQMRTLRTWLFDCGNGIKRALMGSHQIDKRMQTTAPGTFLKVVRGEQVDTRSGARVNTYLFAENKRLTRGQ